MTDARQEHALQQLVQRIDPGGVLRRSWPLTGGVSARITAIEVERSDGQTTKLLVRRHGDVDRRRNAHIARDEYRLLQVAQAHGLAAPKPYDFDDSCELFPTPFLVIGYVDGETEFAPPDLAGYVAQAAKQLAKIHGVRDSPDLAFLPRQEKGYGERPAKLDASMDEGRIRDALESAWPLSYVNELVLLHGDYWPGNILWRGGELVAVIDWEDAAVGDPLADLGNSRLEFLWAFGPEAMDNFTDQYRSTSPADFTNLPYWDLCAALRPCSKLSDWGLDDETEQRMRDRHRLFVTQALDALAAR
ncbi:MAG: phosphotransferase family protein [Thermomicrobiales bacterium]